MAIVIRRGGFVDITGLKLVNYQEADDSKSGKTKILYSQGTANDDLSVDGIKFNVLAYVKKDKGEMLPATFDTQVGDVIEDDGEE